MLTKRLDGENQQDIQEAAEQLQQGEVVAFPTETVYGLGADATNEMAVRNIFKAKGRPADNPLIVHVATREQLESVVRDIPSYVTTLMDAFSPGPLTYILPSNGVCAVNVTAGLDSVGVRMPSHPVASKLLKEAGVPLAAPSANTSGKPSPTTTEHVWQDLNGNIAGILDGGATGVGLESTVIDCTGDVPVILRPGGVTAEQLQALIGEVIVDPALVTTKDQPKAPGMKYRHYAPEVPMWLVDGTPAQLAELIAEKRVDYPRVGVMVSNETADALADDTHMIRLGSQHSLEEIATHLYSALRTFKDGETDLIVCEAFPNAGIGQAIMNRLKKAATHICKL